MYTGPTFITRTDEHGKEQVLVFCCPCPECKDGRIEEVMSGVSLLSEIKFISKGSTSYGFQCMEGGDTDRYQCSECGWKFPSEITSTDELFTYLAHDPTAPVKPKPAGE